MDERRVKITGRQTSGRRLPSPVFAIDPTLYVHENMADSTYHKSDIVAGVIDSIKKATGESRDKASTLTFNFFSEIP